MSLIKKIDADFHFEDDRGSLTQLVHEGYEQVNVLLTKKGVSRGGHYHKEAVECFYVVSGSVEVRAYRLQNAEPETYVFREGDFFEIAPFVAHSMFFPEDCVMVALYDRCVERPDGMKDIYQPEQEGDRT